MLEQELGYLEVGEREIKPNKVRNEEKQRKAKKYAQLL